MEALFPSLTDIESARIVREAIETSDMKFENVNFEKALKYLRVSGGDDHIKELGLSKIAPKYLGSRPDLITIGGEAITDESKWTKMKRDLSEREKRLVIARVVETAVLVCMSSHIYSFGPDLYIQCTGGPIGMRYTASLASVVMKQWDKAWTSLLQREGIDYDLFLRYVDDCRLCMRPLNQGWIWNGETFMYSEESARDDEEKGISHTERTTREITKAMCSMTTFLTFTGEDSTMFTDCTLPTF